jgi:hypothetical protein
MQNAMGTSGFQGFFVSLVGYIQIKSNDWNRNQSVPTLCNAIIVNSINQAFLSDATIVAIISALTTDFQRIMPAPVSEDRSNRGTQKSRRFRKSMPKAMATSVICLGSAEGQDSASDIQEYFQRPKESTLR